MVDAGAVAAGGEGARGRAWPSDVSATGPLLWCHLPVRASSPTGRELICSLC